MVLLMLEEEAAVMVLLMLEEEAAVMLRLSDAEHVRFAKFLIKSAPTSQEGTEQQQQQHHQQQQQTRAPMPAPSYSPIAIARSGPPPLSMRFCHSLAQM